MARSPAAARAVLLLALFGGVALTLSAIGIYGVLAFGVAQRASSASGRRSARTAPILGLVSAGHADGRGRGGDRTRGRGRADALPAGLFGVSAYG